MPIGLIKEWRGGEKILSKSFQFLILVVLLVGIFFRFASLDQKVYWGDETSTSLRVAGYTFEEVRQPFLGAYEINVEALKPYQQLTSEKNWLDVVKGLAAEEPQLPPVYFLLLRSWAQGFGMSVAAIRSFSAVVSLLVFPCMYWLCRELFASTTPAWVAMGLVAISPFYVAYAQEARPQSVWIVTILLSSAALLRAIRINSRWSWGLYAATLVLSFYTYLFSVLVAIAHGLYVLLNVGRLGKTVRAYLVAAFTGALLTTPWVFATISSFTTLGAGTKWSNLKVPIEALVRTWLLNTNRLFIDFNYNFTYRDNLLYLGIVATAILVGYSLYYLCRSTPQTTWSFILLLIGVTALALVLPDLVEGGRRSGVARYLIPSFLGLQLSVAYLLGSKLSSFVSTVRYQQVWRVVAIAVFSVGIMSCVAYSQSNVWWNKYNGLPLPAVASVINQSSQPLVIMSGLPPLEFVYLLNNKVVFQSPQDSIPAGISDIFVISRNYSDSVLQSVLQEHPDLAVEESRVWKDKVDPTYEFKIVLWNLVEQGIQ